MAKEKQTSSGVQTWQQLVLFSKTVFL